MLGLLIPVGPDAREPDRLVDTLDSVRAYEPSQQIHLVLVDDSRERRQLPVDEREWASVDYIRTPLWDGGTPDAYSAMVAGTLDGMVAAGRHRPELLLKLDTDALLIAPVADKLRTLLSDRNLGVVGSYTHTCTGARRDWSGWHKRLVRARLPIAVVPGRRIPGLRSPRDARAVGELLNRARAQGYAWGAHCLGGAYAVGPALLERTELLDWRPWVRTGLGEDVVVGLLATVAGLRIDGSVGPGETFGLAWQTLPLPPEQLLSNRYSVVHSVRDQQYGSETELRSFFRARRPALGH
jgi:hypothetical protein